MYILELFDFVFEGGFNSFYVLALANLSPFRTAFLIFYMYHCDETTTVPVIIEHIHKSHAEDNTSTYPVRS